MPAKDVLLQYTSCRHLHYFTQAVCNTWVKGCKSQLIIMTPLDQLTQPLICQWLHCSSSSDYFTLSPPWAGGTSGDTDMSVEETFTSGVCGCAVSSTQLFLWVNWLWKYIHTLLSDQLYSNDVYEEVLYLSTGVCQSLQTWNAKNQY